MILNAEKIFDEYVKSFDTKGADPHFVIGVSGGADSICLLFLMKEHFPKDHIRVVHVHHMIRDTEADEDSAFVRDICKKDDLYFKEIKVNVPGYARENGLSEEEAGRRIRYGAFEDEALNWEREKGLKEGSVCIAIAHHLEDSAETFLFNLFRGSGIAGLSGIRSESGRIVRPLLKMTRTDIEEYLEHKGQPFRTDSTNHDQEISRNRIRNSIMPEADKICSRAELHICRASEKLSEISDYLENQVNESIEKYVKQTGDEVRIDKKGVASLHSVISSLLILKVLTEMTPMKKDIGEIHVRTVLEMTDGPSGRHADLPYGIKADSSGNELVLTRNEKKSGEDLPAFNTVIMGSADLSDKEKKEIFEGSYPSNDYTKYFDYDKISNIAAGDEMAKPPFFEIRHRKNGDFLTIKKPDGEKGKKSLSDYLTDLKLPAPEKDKLFVVAVGSEILWVIGYRMSDSAKIDIGTEKICKLTVEQGDF